MAFKLYKQYCYPDTTAVGESIKSEMSIVDRGIIDTVTVSQGVVTVNYFDVSNTLQSFTFTPPICETLGFDNSYTGLTTDDALELGVLVSIALVLAFSIKILKRAL